MTIRHFINLDSTYAGSYDGPNPVPSIFAGLSTVASPHQFAGQVWNGSAWIGNNPSPDPDTFKQLVFDDVTITTTEKANLVLYFNLIDSYALDSARLSAGWAAIKVSGLVWLTSGLITKVEAHAATTNIPLV